MTAPAVLVFSDLHLSGDNSLVVGQPTDARLAACLAHAKAHVPDACHTVFAGDLSDGGTAAGYQTLRQMLTDWHTPVTYLMGNEDNRDAFYAVFPEAPVCEDGSFQSQLRFGDYDVLCLDSLDPQVSPRHSGYLGPERRDWLATRLTDSTAKRTIVVLHHPPAAIGIPFFDEIGLRDGSELCDLLARFSVSLCIAGHVHSALDLTTQTCRLCTLGSTGFGLTIDEGGTGVAADPSHRPAYAVLKLGDTGPKITRVVLDATSGFETD